VVDVVSLGSLVSVSLASVSPPDSVVSPDNVAVGVVVQLVGADVPSSSSGGRFVGLSSPHAASCRSAAQQAATRTWPNMRAE
jgi:hypothetical protein